MSPDLLEKLLRNKLSLQDTLDALDGFSAERGAETRDRCSVAESMYWKAKGDVLRAEHRIATASSDKATAAFHMGLSAVSGKPELLEIASARFEEASAKLAAAESDLANAESAVAGRQAALEACRTGQSA